MKVFSTYYKIIKKNALGIFMYLGIFLVVTVLLTKQNSSKEANSFEVTKIDMTLINDDKESPLIGGLIEYLKDYVDFVEVKNEKENLQDALFFRETEYVVRIPEGFYDDFLKNGTMQIEKFGVEDSYSIIYMDTLINKYLNTFKIYKDLLPDLSEDKILEYVKEDISKETTVQLGKKVHLEDGNSLMIYFFNMASYSLLGVLIAGTAKVMSIFLQKDIRQRNQSSPVKARILNGKLILGNYLFSLVIYIVHVIVAIILFKESFFTERGLLMSFNMFVFNLAVLSIGILVSVLVKNKNAQTAAANTISLGMCFVSGAFVPQELLGTTVKQIASFTPGYWYVKANVDINNLTNFSFGNLESIVYSMAIQLGFALAITSVTLFLTRQRALTTA